MDIPDLFSWKTAFFTMAGLVIVNPLLKWFAAITIGTRETIREWNPNRDGPIGEAFLHRCFTASELAASLLGMQSELRSDLGKTHSTLELRETLAHVVLAWTEMRVGAVIVRNASRTKFQAIEFYGPKKDTKNQENEPLVEIEYTVTNKIEKAKMFLHGEEIRYIDCSDEVADLIERHIRNRSKTRGVIDVSSGLQLYDGYIAPIPPK